MSDEQLLSSSLVIAYLQTVINYMLRLITLLTVIDYRSIIGNPVQSMADHAKPMCDFLARIHIVNYCVLLSMKSHHFHDLWIHT